MVVASETEGASTGPQLGAEPKGSMPKRGDGKHGVAAVTPKLTASREGKE